MKCTISWKTYTRTQWEDLISNCQHTTLLQSYYYAQAMRECHQQNVRHGLIQIDGQDAGIVQIQEASLFKKAIHAISIDRGPLWFKGFGKIEHLNAFAGAANEEFPQRFGRKRRFIPEFFAKNSILTVKNWKNDEKKKNYCTFLVDLRGDVNAIHQNLQKKWRNCLSKSEKQGLDVQIDYNLKSLSAVLKNYAQDRMAKGYSGASPKFIASLSKYAAQTQNFLILNAIEDDEIIASVLIFIHGAGATYQIGWTTPYGREKCAHHLLLWDAIGELKNRGIKEFDLGGYNDDIDGIKNFKQGLGGQDIALIGSYY